MDHFGTNLIEGLAEAVVVTDARLDVIAWNGAMERLTGVTRRRAMGRPAAVVLSILRSASVADHLERALAGEPSATGEVPVPVSAPPREGWLVARFLPWRDDAGRVAGVIGLVEDVGERRRREAVVRAVGAVAQAMASSLELDEVLDTIVAKTAEVMGADGAMVVSWDGQAPEFSVLRATGRLSEAYANRSLPLAGGPIGRALREARPVTTSDILADPTVALPTARREEITRKGFKAVAAAPLRSKGRVHGALVVHYWAERGFGDEDVTLLEVLAEQAALAIDNARLYTDATRRAERLRVMAEVEQTVGESLVIDHVLRRITQAAARLLDAPVAHLWTVDAAARVLRLQTSWTEPGLPEVGIPAVIAFGEGIAGRAAAEQTALYVPDVTEDPRALSGAWASGTGVRCLLSVPIVSADGVLGVLSVRARDGSVASAENRALVGSLAARAAVALQNARSYADALRRAARLRDLVAVSRSITASLDSADVMRQIVRAAAAMSPGALAAVHVFDQERRVLRAAAVSGPEWHGLPLDRPAGAGLPGLVAESHAPVLVAQPLGHPRTLQAQWWKQRPAASYYGVPIDVGDAFVGVLDYILPDGLPDREEQEALRLLAAQAGVAIRNADLFQAERTQAERVRALAAVNQRLSSALDLDALLRTIGEAAAQLTGVRFASFWLADQARSTLSMVGGSVPEINAEFEPRTIAYDTGAVGRVARLRAPLLIDDVFTPPSALNLAWWHRWGLRAFAGYPVLAGGELLAVLGLAHSEPMRFEGEMAGVIEAFVTQASIAIQNARLYREAERRRESAEALARLGRDLTGALDVERICDLVTRGAAELLNVHTATMFFSHPEDGTLRVRASFGSGAEPDIRELVLQPGEGLAGRAVRERRAIASADVLTDPDMWLSASTRVLVARGGFRAVMAAPLSTHERVLGALVVGDEPRRQFTADELKMLQAFADQAALALENARLYASVRESLARLRDTQTQLVHVAKMSGMGQLVSGVAHELNNPLSVIIGYGQLLLARDMPPQVRRPVELMVAQGDRMAKIVRNLLYFARQRPPERGAVNIQEVVERTLALRLNQLTLSGIRVEKDFAPGLPEIAGDAQQLEQVLLNLLLNAEQAILEARPGGCIRLRTRLREGGGALVAQVIDDGPGIPPDALPRVFEPFFTTKSVGSGTGLGLSVSYGIVEEHGGRLTVQSRPGETIFTLELPLLPPPAARAGAGGSRALASGAGRVALVVEDEPSVLDLVVTLLGETGWNVDVADGGHAGLDCVRRRRYDLIISDMRMPEGSGEEFYREALAHDPTLGHRFIFVTGDTANPDGWKFLEGSGVPVIEKPFQPATLEAAVDRVMTALTSQARSA